MVFGGGGSSGSCFGVVVVVVVVGLDVSVLEAVLVGVYPVVMSAVDVSGVDIVEVSAVVGTTTAVVVVVFAF